MSIEKMQKLAKTDYKCTCGKVHSSDVDRLVLGSGIINSLPEILADYKGENILLVSDKNTYEACGKKVKEVLSDFYLQNFVYPDDHIDSTLHYMGRLLVEVTHETGLILAVGSGVINDICRAVSYRVKIPYIIVGTAASMDGYTSVISPTFMDGRKVSIQGVTPRIVIGDYDVIKNAPSIMLKAGFGDVLGKEIALTDWRLTNIMTGEHICEECCKMVEEVVETCVKNIDGVSKSSIEAVEPVFEALVFSGIIMALYGGSRPASGTEHIFGHYWDITAINAGRSHALHGISVGVGTYIAALIYEKVEHLLPKDFAFPSSEYILNLLERADAPMTPNELGLSKDEFYDSVMNAWSIKPEKYTVLHFARDKGMLKSIADQLTEKFYGF